SLLKAAPCCIDCCTSRHSSSCMPAARGSASQRRRSMHSILRPRNTSTPRAAPPLLLLLLQQQLLPLLPLSLLPLLVPLLASGSTMQMPSHESGGRRTALHGPQPKSMLHAHPASAEGTHPPTHTQRTLAQRACSTG